MDNRSVNPETLAGDPFAYAGRADEERPCFYCLEGWVFLTSIGHDGEEIVESVRCRKCGGSGTLGKPERRERGVHLELDGGKIFDWRWRNFATAEQAAEMARTSLSTWLRAENGKGAVTLRTARKIASVMGTTAQALERS